MIILFDHALFIVTPYNLILSVAFISNLRVKYDQTHLEDNSVSVAAQLVWKLSTDAVNILRCLTSVRADNIRAAKEPGAVILKFFNL